MEVDFHSTKGDGEDGRHLYECVVEEVTLEGLDGITFQGKGLLVELFRLGPKVPGGILVLLIHYCHCVK
jgi:hypothetical protein